MVNIEEKKICPEERRFFKSYHNDYCKHTSYHNYCLKSVCPDNSFHSSLKFWNNKICIPYPCSHCLSERIVGQGMKNLDSLQPCKLCRWQKPSLAIPMSAFQLLKKWRKYISDENSCHIRKMMILGFIQTNLQCRCGTKYYCSNIQHLQWVLKYHYLSYDLDSQKKKKKKNDRNCVLKMWLKSASVSDCNKLCCAWVLACIIRSIVVLYHWTHWSSN